MTGLDIGDAKGVVLGEFTGDCDGVATGVPIGVAFGELTGEMTGELRGAAVGHVAGGKLDKSQIPPVTNSSNPLILAYTEGVSGRPHPNPNDTTPTKTLSTTKGPPLSP